MSRTMLQSKPLRVPPLVKVGTIRSMGMVAKKLAVVRKAIEAIREVEDELLLKGNEERNLFRSKMQWMSNVARSAGGSAAETAMILKGIKGDLENYLKEFRTIRKSPEWREL